MWAGTALSAFLYEQTGSNSKVGFIEAANGLTVLIFAVPVGYVADTWGKARLCKWGGVLQVLCSVAMIYTIMMCDGNFAYTMLLVCMCLWGICDGVTNGPLQALFADSVPTGGRSEAYGYLFNCWLIGNCVGPTISIVIFEQLSNDWTLKELRIVIAAGLVLTGMSSFFLCGLSDKDVHNPGRMDELADADADADAEAPAAPVDDADEFTVPNPMKYQRLADMEVDADEKENAAMKAAAQKSVGGSDTESDTESDTGSVNKAASGDPTPDSAPALTPAPAAAAPDLTPLQKKYQWTIPYISFGSGLISSLGSGMTVKFFPLFWKNAVGLTPVNTQFIYLAVPLVMMGFGTMNKPLARCLGRAQTITLFRVIGICNLYLLTWLVGRKVVNPLIVIPVYLIRTGFMNAPYPLEESIVMDNVSSATRARWKSLDSIQQFGWCGSAALGGVLIDARGYEATFQLTAAIQLLATISFIPLFWIVPKKEGTAAPRAVVARSGAQATAKRPKELVDPVATASKSGSGSGSRAGGGDVAVERSTDLSAPLLDASVSDDDTA